MSYSNVPESALRTKISHSRPASHSPYHYHPYPLSIFTHTMKHARVKQPKGASRRNRPDNSDDDDDRSYASDISHITADSAASFQSFNSNTSSSSKRGKRDEVIVATFEDQFNHIVDDLDEKRTRYFSSSSVCWSLDQ